MKFLVAVTPPSIYHNVKSTSSEGGGLRIFVEEGGYLELFHGVGFSSEGGKGCLREKDVVVGDVFIESILSSSLSIFPRILSLSTTVVRGWSFVPEAVSFFPFS